MTIRPDLVAATNRLLATLGPQQSDLDVPGSTGKTAREDVAFEAFLFSEVLTAFKQSGCKLTSKPAGQHFVFRRAPGDLNTTGTDCSYVHVRKGRRTIDLLLDVFVETRSPGAYLEIDILAISSAYVRRCRKKRHNPRYRALRLAIEAKHFSGDVGTGPAKAFIGVIERTRCPSSTAVFVTSTEITTNAKLLFAGMKAPVSYFENVTPLHCHASFLTQFRAFLDSTVTALV